MIVLTVLVVVVAYMHQFLPSQMSCPDLCIEVVDGVAYLIYTHIPVMRSPRLYAVMISVS